MQFFICLLDGAAGEYMPMSTCQYQTHMEIQQKVKDSLSVNILTLTHLYTTNQRPPPPFRPPPHIWPHFVYRVI